MKTEKLHDFTVKLSDFVVIDNYCRRRNNYILIESVPELKCTSITGGRKEITCDSMEINFQLRELMDTNKLTTKFVQMRHLVFMAPLLLILLMLFSSCSHLGPNVNVDYHLVQDHLDREALGHAIGQSLKYLDRLPGQGRYYGTTHSPAVGDVDGDGCDELLVTDREAVWVFRKPSH